MKFQNLLNTILRVLKMLFNFSKSILQNINTINENINIARHNPITVNQNEWKTVDEKNSSIYLSKVYYFKSYDNIIYFINEIIKELSKNKNVPKIIIDKNSVEIMIFSDFIADITELEINISKFIDEIYDDIRYI